MNNYNIFDDYGIFCPELASKSFGMSARFKGGSSPSSPSSTMSDTAIKKYGRTELYPMVENALDGKGYGTDEWLSQRKNTLFSGLNESYNTAKSEFQSQMLRTIKPEDTRVKNSS